jgi:uncharacterized protein with HEPN domain
MSRDVSVYLEDMLEAIARVREYTVGFDQVRLAEDRRTFDAVVRNLEILGEAAKHVPDDVRALAPNVEWRRIAGLRDVLIHGYFHLAQKIIWDVVQHHLDPLEGSLRQLLAVWPGDLGEPNGEQVDPS